MIFDMNLFLPSNNLTWQWKLPNLVLCCSRFSYTFQCFPPILPLQVGMVGIFHGHVKFTFRPLPCLMVKHGETMFYSPLLMVRCPVRARLRRLYAGICQSRGEVPCRRIHRRELGRFWEGSMERWCFEL